MLISVAVQSNEVTVLKSDKKIIVEEIAKIEEKKESIKIKFGKEFFIAQLGATDCFRACEKIVAKFNSKLKVVPSQLAHYIAKEDKDTLQLVSDDYSLLDKMLKLGLPVVVGVHHTYRYGYNEGTTDHFILIVRKGWDNLGMYYQFYDVGSEKHGTNPNNKLRLHGGFLKGSRKDGREYVVTQIRSFKKIK